MIGWAEVYISPQMERAEEKRRYLEDKGISCMMQAEREDLPSSGESIAFRRRHMQPNILYKVLVKEVRAKEAEELLNSR